MTHQDAERILGLLVAATPGWNSANDETFQIYANQLETLRDPDIAVKAVEHIIQTHPGPARPTVAAVFEAYRWEAHRRVMNVPQIGPATTKIVSVREGRQIAARAYAKHCASRDPDTDVHILSGYRTNEPNPDFLAGLLGNL